MEQIFLKMKLQAFLRTSKSSDQEAKFKQCTSKLLDRSLEPDQNSEDQNTLGDQVTSNKSFAAQKSMSRNTTKIKSTFTPQLCNFLHFLSQTTHNKLQRKLHQNLILQFTYITAQHIHTK